MRNNKEDVENKQITYTNIWNPNKDNDIHSHIKHWLLKYTNILNTEKIITYKAILNMGKNKNIRSHIKHG